MSKIILITILALTLSLESRALTSNGGGQKLEFEVASVKSVPPPTGFRFSFAADAGSGGPGTADPGMFRCGSCTLATLIGKAFHLRSYQLPGRSSLPGGNFAIAAKIPPAATQEEFEAMLQNLLKDRFGFAFHFEEKTMSGYLLVVAKGGSRLKESTGDQVAERPRTTATNEWGGGAGHTHTGTTNFNGHARYQGSGRTMDDLVRVLSDQLGRPVDDQTGLKGKYDILLSWAAESTGGSQDHADTAGAEHAGHGGATASPGGAGSVSGDTSGLGLLDALPSQLGLKLVPANKSTARILIVDHIEKVPVSN